LTTLRDFYAFEAHVRQTFANRGKEIPPEWYQFPAFNFCNPNSIFGHQAIIPYPRDSQALDYELEVACIIGKIGRDIHPEQAMEYVFGFSILNDWSARDIQIKEMRIGLGPCKSKDFGTSMGPVIITPDEIANRSTDRPGVYDLTMKARVNGKLVSKGNWKDIYYSFGEMIARASAGVYLYPGDVLGSGTVGSGCLLETTKGEGPWLNPGDIIELEIEQIGVLSNQIVKSLD
jgi:fumarylacetoacetate (FAA) hydrolase